MEEWLFMFSCNLVIPFIMLINGGIYLKKPPRTINWLYGYRTRRSMKNQETWDYAHCYCGRLWYRCGGAMLVLSIIGMLPVYQKSVPVIGMVSGIICIVQCFVLVAAIFPTERALKRKFGV